jgi:hypothetical protein
MGVMSDAIAAFIVMWAAKAMIDKTSTAIGMMRGKGIMQNMGVVSAKGAPIQGAAAAGAIRTGSATATGSITMFQKMFIKFGGFFQKIFSKVGGKFIGKIIGFLAKGFLRFLGPIGIILSFLPSILKMFGVGNDKADEAKKQRERTNALLEKPSKQESHLQSIAKSLNQANIYQEQLIMKSDENTQAVKDSGTAKAAVVSTSQWDTAPRMGATL